MRSFTPRSLIAQLSLAYGAAFLAMLITFGGLAIVLTNQLAITLRSHLQNADRRIPEVMALHPNPTIRLINVAPALSQELREPGVAVAIMERRTHRAYFNDHYEDVDFGPQNQNDESARHEHAPLPTRPIDQNATEAAFANRELHHVGRHFPLPPVLLLYSFVFGIGPIEHHLSNGSIVLLPDPRLLGTPLITYMTSLIALAIGAFAVACLIARTLSMRAIEPLYDVTKALRIIGQGDFRTHEIHFSQRTEMGALAQAYNEAVTRVDQAFHERDVVEQRMRQFIADAGHEIRTPLTVILGYIDILARDAAKDGNKKAAIFATIAAEGQRMRSLVNNLILLMRLDQENQRRPRVIDLTALVADIVAALASLDPQQRLETVFRAEARIVGDIDELREAVTNLVDNALKYAPTGPITITVDHRDDSACLTIHDHGEGIAPTEQTLIFDRFYRGESSASIEGSGLGLAIAKRAVERSGGTLRLISSPQHGTEFSLRFPAHHAEKHALAAAQSIS